MKDYKVKMRDLQVSHTLDIEIETRLTDESFESVMGECEIYKP
jgi:hypothetical protein